MTGKESWNFGDTVYEQMINWTIGHIHMTSNRTERWNGLDHRYEQHYALISVVDYKNPSSRQLASRCIFVDVCVCVWLSQISSNSNLVCPPIFGLRSSTCNERIVWVIKYIFPVMKWIMPTYELTVMLRSECTSAEIMHYQNIFKSIQSQFVGEWYCTWHCVWIW